MILTRGNVDLHLNQNSSLKEQVKQRMEREINDITDEEFLSSIMNRDEVEEFSDQIIDYVSEIFIPDSDIDIDETNLDIGRQRYVMNKSIGNYLEHIHCSKNMCCA